MKSEVKQLAFTVLDPYLRLALFIVLTPGTAVVGGFIRALSGVKWSKDAVASLSQSNDAKCSGGKPLPPHLFPKVDGHGL